MHKNKIHRDAQATRQSRREKRFFGRHSYISTRIHPGTDHQCVYLAGAVDCDVARIRALVRANGRCEMCGRWDSRLEVDHIAHKTKVERCWCQNNLRALCKHCHRSRHVRILWSPKAKEVADGVRV